MTTRADDVERADAIAGARETAPLLDVIAHDAHDGDDEDAQHHHHRKVLRAKIGVVSALALVGAGALCATAFGTVSSLGGASTGATSSIDGDALDARASLGQAASGAGVVDDRAAGLGDAWVDRFGKLNEGEIKELARKDLAGKREGFGLPVFLHLPKNGGTAIETALGHVGVAAGFCHLPKYGPARPYRLRRRAVGFEEWHTPPAEHVPDSWTIVRNPYKRAASDFIWSIRLTPGGIFDALNPGYSNFNCERFQDFVKDSIKGLVASDLRKCYQEKRYTMQGMGECDATVPESSHLDCGSHALPQSVMAAAADRVFKLETCFDPQPGKCGDARNGNQMDNIVGFMRAHYHPAARLDQSINAWNHNIEKPDLEPCFEGFDPDVLRDFNDVYANDLEQFRYVRKQPKSTPGSGFDEQSRPNHRPGQNLGSLQRSLPPGEVVQDVSGPGCL